MGRSSRRRRPSEDDLLVARAIAGDGSAWAALVERHATALMGCAWRMLGDRAEAEDVTQETFLRLLAKADRWRPGGATLRAWLYRVAVNLCVDRLRARRAAPLHAATDEVSFELAEGPLDRKLRVRKALDGLPERQKTALVLVHYEGFTNREAAELLDVSVDALESLLARARRTLRHELEPIRRDLIGAAE